MARGGDETGRSYVGLISFLVVIVAFIAILAAVGVEPLGGGHGAEGGGDGPPIEGEGEGGEDHSADTLGEAAPDGHGAPDGAQTPGAAAAPTFDDASAGEAGGVQESEAPLQTATVEDDEIATLEDVNASLAEIGMPDLLPLPPGDVVLTRLLFGSCVNQTRPAPILKYVAARRPQVFLWVGDNVYADSVDDETGEILHGPEHIELAYRTLYTQDEFRTLAGVAPFLATWDDHDYGLNDSGADLPYKADSKALFLRYLGRNASPAIVSHDGVYDARIFGPEGARTQIILLDTRTFRSPLKPTDEKNAPGKERYMPDPDPAKTMLGAAQWAWLEEQLRQPADIRLIVSSIQVIADGHGWEAWRTLPAERQKLYDLIAATGAKGVVFLSGDRHAGGIYVNREVTDYPLAEITSSSLNLPVRAWGVTDATREADGYRIDDLVLDENFGQIEIDWEARAIFLELRGLEGQLLQSLTVRLNV